jgi:Tat protein secretion system quality control protein TatD with DNase activity
VAYVAARLAEIKGLPVAEVARVTSTNFERLFGLPAPSKEPTEHEVLP